MVEADIDFTKTAQENAEEYFRKAKELEKKAAGAGKAIKDLENKKEEIASSAKKERRLKQIREREWYEKYNWFFSSSGMLAIGGRSAQQNDEINAKYFEANDLFFHANIFGASAVVLKNGTNADDNTKQEAAQFAACYSKAWENGLSTIDVFAARRDQVSKSSQKGYVSPGSFLISGEREWFKNVKLELYACIGSPNIKINKAGIKDNAVLNLVPANLIVDTSGLMIIPASAYEHGYATSKAVRLRPGVMKKSDAAKEIAKRLGFEDIDYIMQHLPSGGFYIEQ
ncbi:MAG: NFACT RNA binding domain-containing protein [Candidatus Micrarchaeia archaeon]